MKSYKYLATLIVILGYLLPVESAAQCASATMLRSVDTLVRGTGNDSYTFNAKQFNPAIGTLVAVVVKTNVSLGYAFRAENLESSSRSVAVGVGRYDYLVGGALTNGYYANGIQKNYGPYTMGAADANADTGADFIAVPAFSFASGSNVINDSITTSVVGFLGTGNIAFSYFPSTYSTIPADLSYSFSAADTTRFSVTYYYCSPVVLAADLLSFMATKTGKQEVLLNWQSTNTAEGRSYSVQQSDDGSKFIEIGTRSFSERDDDKGEFHWNADVSGIKTGIVYFRLRVIDSDGTVSYSEIRAVNLSIPDQNKVSVWPNPAASFLDISVPGIIGENYTAEIYTINGMLLQTTQVTLRGTVRINFKQSYADGVYFVRLIGTSGHRIDPLRFIIHR